MIRVVEDSPAGVAGLVNAVAPSSNNEIITAKADSEKTQVSLSFVGNYGNNCVSAGTSYNTLLTFSAKPNGGVRDTTNQATSETDLGNKATLNGVPVKNLTGFVMDMGSLGSANVALCVDKTLLVSTEEFAHPVLHIPAGTEFYDVLLPEITLTFINNKWNVSGYGEVTTVLTGFASDTWNNYPDGEYSANIIDFKDQFGSASIATNIANPYKVGDIYYQLYSIGLETTLDGVPLRELAETYNRTEISFAHGLNHLFIRVPNALLSNGSVLHISSGVQFYNQYIPEVTIRFNGSKWEFVKVADHGKVDTHISGGHTDSWNNVPGDYNGLWDIPNGVSDLTMFATDSTFTGGITAKGAGMYNVLAGIKLDGVPLTELDGNVGIYTYLNGFLPTNCFMVAVPKGVTNVGSILEFDDGLKLFDKSLAGCKFIVNSAGKYVKYFDSPDFGDPVTHTSAYVNAYVNNSTTFSPDFNRTIIAYTNGGNFFVDQNASYNLIDTSFSAAVLLNGKSISLIRSENAGSTVTIATQGAFNGGTGFYIDYPASLLSSTEVNTLEVIDKSVISESVVEGALFAMNPSWSHTTWWPANWVTFDKNDGSSNPTFKKPGFTGASKIIDMTVEVDNPTKDGYRFNGWKLNGSEIDPNAVVTGNITLVADWVEQKEVTFIANGVETKVSVDVGGKVSPIEDPIKENAHFSGWYTDGGYLTSFDFENTSINENTSIYGQFIDCSDGLVVYSEPTADHKMTATLYCAVDTEEVLVTETVEGIYNVDTAATCLEAETGHYTYTFASTKFEAQTENVTVGDPLEHDYGEVEVVWDGDMATATMTCERAGCASDCEGHVVAESKQGTFVEDTSASCESCNKGHYEVTFTDTRLGSAQTAANSVDGSDPATDHDWEVTVTWDGASATATGTCKNDGSHIINETKEASYVKDTDATCHSYETGHYEVVFNNTALGSAQTDANSVENTAAGKPEHTYSKVEYEWDGVEACVAEKHCTNDGCDEEIVENGTISYEVITPATCTEDGVGRYTASFDTLGSTTYDVEIPASGHDDESIGGKAATCNEDGYKECYYCTRCEQYFEDEAGTKLIGDADAYEAWKVNAGKLAKEDVEHIPANAVKENVVAATCTEEGSYDLVVYCSFCGEKLSSEHVTVQATGHTPEEAVNKNVVAATCTEAGSHDEVVYCSVCGEELSRVHVVDEALGHDWGEGVVTKEATCTEDGIKTYTCSHCDETKTEAIPATGHNYGDLIAEVAATTEKEGMKAHYYCADCDKYFDANKQECTKESLVIAKLPQPAPENIGCFGSVISASAVITGLSLAGAALIAAKKKED